jgi:hypothetical protein
VQQDHGPSPDISQKVKTPMQTETRQTTHQRRAEVNKAFATVTDQLEELLCKQFAGFQSGRTNAADYRSDAAIAARAVLSPRDYLLWQHSFLNFTVPEARLPAEIAKHIRLTVGKAYARRGLEKTGLYFAKRQKPNDT